MVFGRETAEPARRTGLAGGAQGPGELGAGGDAELAVYGAQMRVDGGGGQVQLFGDLLVGQAGRDQLGDPLLAGGQGAGSRSPQTRPSLSVLHHLVRRQLKT